MSIIPLLLWWNIPSLNFFKLSKYEKLVLDELVFSTSGLCGILALVGSSISIWHQLYLSTGCKVGCFPQNHSIKSPSSNKQVLHNMGVQLNSALVLFPRLAHLCLVRAACSCVIEEFEKIFSQALNYSTYACTIPYDF